MVREENNIKNITRLITYIRFPYNLQGKTLIYKIKRPKSQKFASLSLNPSKSKEEN